MFENVFRIRSRSTGNGHSTILRRGGAQHTVPVVSPIKKSHQQQQANDLLDVMVDDRDDDDDDTVGTATAVAAVQDADKMSLYLAQVLDVAEAEPVAAGATAVAVKRPQQPDADAANAGGAVQVRNAPLRRLNYEPKPTISDVYHERKIGLGLAPSLLKLLSLDKLHLPRPAAKDCKTSGGGGWLSPSVLKRFGAESTYGELLNRRDEGDGRSVAESQSSTGSYKKRIDPGVAARGFESLAEEDQQQQQLSSGVCREPKLIRIKKKSSCAPPPPPPLTAATESSSPSPPSTAVNSSSYVVDL